MSLKNGALNYGALNYRAMPSLHIQRVRSVAFQWLVGVLAAALLVAAVAMVSPRPAEAVVPPLSPQDLNAAMALWAANGPSDYTMSYITACTDCPSDMLVTVTVEAGTIVRAVDHVGVPISIVGVGNPEIFDIDGLFAKIQSAIVNGPYVQAFFDPTNGRPINAYFQTGFYNVPPFEVHTVSHYVFGYVPLTGLSCMNRDVTVVLTPGNDSFNSQSLAPIPGNMVVAGLEGDDTITTHGTSDFICADDGDDVVRSGDGDDVVAGNDGDDTLYGERGNDLLMGGNGADRLLGQAGADDLRGGAAADIIYGGVGADVVRGGGGGDRIWGGDGWDQLWGGSGPDRIWGGAGFDMIEGEAGNDRMYGGNHADVLHGGDGNDFGRGNGGSDLVNGEAGNDTVWGDSGDDLLYGADGDDHLNGGLGSDGCFTGAGTDTTANCTTVSS